MLPEEQSSKLRELYQQKDRGPLVEYVCALRAKQWTLQDIANALGVQRSTVQYWERKNKDTKSVKDAPHSPKEIQSWGTKTVKTYILIPQNDRIRLNDLSKQAKKISNRTPADSPLHSMSQELDELILKHLKRLVPVSALAEAMGVTHRAVRARIERSNIVV